MKHVIGTGEKRGSSLVGLGLPVEICCSKTPSQLKGLLVNISLDGMSVEVESGNIPVGAAGSEGCMARIVFQGQSSKFIVDDVVFRVSRVDGNRVVLEFSEALINYPFLVAPLEFQLEYA